ncbi:MAG TPA: hypothetical protein VG963_07625, partial [Polyangiaceae bacterium]|nr:hypothetical protein [Polyangiaceae bacterium]
MLRFGTRNPDVKVVVMGETIARLSQKLRGIRNVLSKCGARACEIQQPFAQMACDEHMLELCTVVLEP